MGDMADDLIDSMWDSFDEDDEGSQCRYCGKSYLVWVKCYRGRVVLCESDGETPHNCKKKRHDRIADPSEFPEL